MSNQISGVGNRVYNLSLELAKLGHDVEVVTRRNQEVETGLVRKRVVDSFSLPLIPPVPMTNLAIFNMQAYKELKREPTLEAVLDVQHVHLSYMVDMIRAASRAPGRLVLTCHGIERYATSVSGFGPKGILAWSTYGVEKGTLQKVDSIVCVSEFVKCEVLRTGPSLPVDIQVISNGIRVKDFSDLRSMGLKNALGVETLVVSIGDPSTRKGTETLLRAFSKLESKSSALAIGGNWGRQPKAKYLRLEDELGIRGRVLHFSNVPRSVIKSLLAEADIYVQPSNYESQGIAPLEAMATETPVIASRVGGMAETIGDAGILVPPGDILSLSKAVDLLIQDKSLRIVMAKKALERAMKYEWQEIAKRYSSFLESEPESKRI